MKTQIGITAIRKAQAGRLSNEFKRNKAMKTQIGIVIFSLALMMIPIDVIAAVNGPSVIDHVEELYKKAASSWEKTLRPRAEWLFWVLALISMVWTFGMLALKKADIGDFYGELLKFTITTGFFWWLLIHGPAMTTGLAKSLITLGETASNKGSPTAPNDIIIVGFKIFAKAIYTALFHPIDGLGFIFIAVVLLVILAVISANMLVLFVSVWMLAYAGIFFLGFGGCRWTSDMAIAYFKTTLGISAQLLTMVLLIGIGQTIFDEYLMAMDASLTFSDLGAFLVAAVLLLILCNKIPPLIGQLAQGGGSGALGSGFGAGSAIAAAGAAAAAGAMAGAAIASGATNIAGGVQALMAAANKASESASNGSDTVSRMAGSVGGLMDSQQGGANSSSTSNTTPLANAMGGAGSVADLGSGVSGDSSSQSNTGGASGSGGSKYGTSTAKNLLVGAGAVAKQKFMDRASKTIGGQIAKAINESGSPASPTFNNNSLSGAENNNVDPAAEVDAFVNGSGNAQS